MGGPTNLKVADDFNGDNIGVYRQQPRCASCHGRAMSGTPGGSGGMEGDLVAQVRPPVEVAVTSGRVTAGRTSFGGGWAGVGRVAVAGMQALDGPSR